MQLEFLRQCGFSEMGIPRVQNGGCCRVRTDPADGAERPPQRVSHRKPAGCSRVFARRRGSPHQGWQLLRSVQVQRLSLVLPPELTELRGLLLCRWLSLIRCHLAGPFILLLLAFGVKLVYLDQGVAPAVILSCGVEAFL